MSKPDTDRVAHAQLYGAATAIRDALRLNPDHELEQRHRAEWPALWERIDALTTRVTHTP